MGNTQMILEWACNNIWQLIVLGSLFIQISPIKINPWSALFKWVAQMLTGDLKTKLDSICDEVRTNEKDRIRWEVLDFANSCRNGRRHTKDEFEHIIELNKKYNHLLTLTNDSNGVFEEEYKYIQRLYAERLEKNDFLQ